MFVVHSDTVFEVPPNTTPNYNSDNPLLKMLYFFEGSYLSAERELYLAKSLQYLIPFSHLDMYGPQGEDSQNLTPEKQDNKTDFQKQNVKDFVITDTYVARGWVTAGEWTGPFLRLSYDGSPDSKLAQLAQAGNGQLGPFIKLWLKVRDVATPELIRVPYNEKTHRYELEIWGYPGNDLQDKLDTKGRDSLERGELIVRTDLVHGHINDFQRNGLDDKNMFDVAASNTMHPIHKLHLEVAWADESETFWDSQNGANYQYEFNMILRGWDHFLSVGISPNAHGGVGFLHYRNLLSNYGKFAGTNELARQVEPWMFNAEGNKGQSMEESFFAVDYMDLHILKPNAGIGLHRHRDNQEVFFMIDGEGIMVVGDWAKFPQRERCFEVRLLQAGHFAMLKGGNLHALMNTMDENISLFMFGGYD